MRLLKIFLLILSFFTLCAFYFLLPGSLTDNEKFPVNYEIIIKTFLGNEKRNYYGNKAPSKLDVLWKHYLGKGETVISKKLGSKIWAGAGWTGQPLLVSEDTNLFIIQGAYDHHLKKINAKTGEIVWQYKFDDVIKGTGTIWENKSSNDIKDRLVILQGSRLGTNNPFGAEVIPSYRAISYFTGEELWRVNVKRTMSYSRDVDGSAIILKDTAYLAFENSIFTVFDPDYKQAEIREGILQPKVYREIQLYKYEDAIAHRYNVVTESSPSLLNGKLYIASGAGYIYGYDLAKKEIAWEFYIGSDIDGSAIVTYDSCILVSVEKQYIQGRGGIFKLDPSKSPEDAVVWYFPVNDKDFVGWKGGVIGSVGINDAYHYDGLSYLAAFMAIDGNLYIVEHDKTDPEKTVYGPDNKKKYPAPELISKKYIGPSISTPVFTENSLIAAGYHGILLFQYDTANNFTLMDKLSASFESTPVIHDEKVFIASRNGYFYCLGNNF